MLTVVVPILYLVATPLLVGGSDRFKLNSGTVKPHEVHSVTNYIASYR